MAPYHIEQGLIPVQAPAARHHCLLPLYLYITSLSNKGWQQQIVMLLKIVLHAEMANLVLLMATQGQAHQSQSATIPIQLYFC